MYSRRTYTRHQHLALILLKEVMRIDYRSIVDLPEVTTGITEIIELGQIPDFITLQKFLRRIRSVYPDIVFE